MIVFDQIFFSPLTPGQPGVVAFWTSRGWLYEQLRPVGPPLTLAPLPPAPPAVMSFEGGAGI